MANEYIPWTPEDEITAEDGLAVPTTNPGRPGKYPWRTMEIDQNFVIAMPLQSAQSYAWGRGRAYGRKFKVAMHEGKVRVWRTA